MKVYYKINAAILKTA